MEIIGQILLFALEAYFWIIIISVVMSWLIAFEVVNAKSPQAQNLLALLAKATEPVYKQLRKFIPMIGGIDVTPMIVIFAIMILKNIVVKVFIY
jgi:YggT family protein